ncbi:protein downstream neighbor of son homolog [Teleopsis dalmanni]|uniref:protein downstream neighbor of son homolog n=1 Tax=Teleopsis dalmanni TaxID=139649 RepID=UPI0018CD9159|nr:protein downstream neighbor of son homolog [Teleopsis dalmanni]
MSNTDTKNISQNWKRPNELIKLQRLKQKKKQLAARFKQTNNNENVVLEDKASLLEAKIAQKRKNPFAKSAENESKKARNDQVLLEQDDTLLAFINTNATTTEAFVRETPVKVAPAKLVLKSFDSNAFSQFLHQADEDDAIEEQIFSKHLPMDWSLKTRVRIFCESDLPTTTLKTSQMASGLTSFVRCIYSQNEYGMLDISPTTRFNQAAYYWQHPHLPWMTLFPRNSKDNIGITIGERERKALAEDWDFSFHGLFHLLRGLQCPYFYVCANTFTVLFRAAGTAGRTEMHALMTPSTRGIRSNLRQEGIEFTMPLKNDGGLNRSADGNYSEESGSIVTVENPDQEGVNTGGNDEQEEDEWLESLGVDEKEIRRIQTAHTRKIKAKEMAEDFSDNSLLLIEGVECQGFFSFLLNAKSTISSIGRLAGVPPTLLAPVAFPKATMQHLTLRSNKVRMDGVDYNSIEAKGIVLPTFLPYIFQLLSETKNTFSAALASSNNTLAFSKATQALTEDPNCSNTNTTEGTDAHQVFQQGSLCDCGLNEAVIECMCRTGQYSVALLERVCYDKECGYAWS